MKGGFEMAYDRYDKRKPAEAIILKEILGPHPLICNLQAFTKDTFWFEYCGLGDLQDLCSGYVKHNIYVPEAFIWHAYRQLAEALAFIHKGYTTSSSLYPTKHFQPVVHRDIKPSNVFIRHNSRSIYPDLVLADFGLAITTTALHKDNNYLLGTPMFQPPELPLHSREGDVWAVGACIHQLASGSPPMKVKPRGMDSKKWYASPSARAVADLRSLGYSHNLHAALMWTLRKRKEDRKIGKELVDSVTRGEKDYLSKHRRVELERWVGEK